jgi:hypothetical protein
MQPDEEGIEKTNLPRSWREPVAGEADAGESIPWKTSVTCDDMHNHKSAVTGSVLLMAAAHKDGLRNCNTLRDMKFMGLFHCSVQSQTLRAAAATRLNKMQPKCSS